MAITTHPVGRIGARTRATIAALVISVLSAGTAAAQIAVDRGRQLVNGVAACGNCHTPFTADGKPDFSRAFSGGRIFKEPGFVSYAPNITPDADTGIGRWTDAQIVRAIREGVRPDGSLIGPPMAIPEYRGISDEDVHAMVAYLRSVPAVRSETPKSKYNVALAAYGPPVANVPTPPKTDLVAYGRYLAGPVGHCMECHTPRDANRHPDYANKLGAGGNTFRGPWGESLSRNLTPHETGLKDWSDDQIARAIREGVDRQGNRYKPPMGFGYYKNMSDEEIRAIIAYLRSLKPLPFAAGG